MFASSGLLLVAAVAAVGVLHTIVPDHWVPITLLARQRGWSRGETARAALQAGIGHAATTLVLGLAVWIAGVAFATQFGRIADTLASLALIGFGGWIALAGLSDLRAGHGHSHAHGHGHASADGAHGPEIRRIDTGHGGHAHRHSPRFTAHTHEDEDGPAGDPLYAPLRGGVAVLARHAHVHRHGATVHAHWHDHDAESRHDVIARLEFDPPPHSHKHKTNARTALLLILGSSPMVEGIPAFFAAARYGVALILLMALVFALSTIATYVLLCVISTAGLERVRLGAVERYGEVLSGAFIALVGIAFWIWPVM